MKDSLFNVWNSLLKLFRFLAWYGIVVVMIFYLLPIVGLVVEMQYDMLSSAAKFFAVIGFFLVAGAWHIMSVRDRLRNAALDRGAHRHGEEPAKFQGFFQ